MASFLTRTLLLHSHTTWSWLAYLVTAEAKQLSLVYKFASGKETEVQQMSEGHTALTESPLCHHATRYRGGKTMGTVGETGCRRKLGYSGPWIPTAFLQGTLQRDQSHLEQNRGQTSCLTTEIQIQAYSPVFAMSWIYPCLSLISVCDPALFPGITGNMVFIRACNVPLLKFGLWEERPKHWSTSRSSGVSG